MRPEIAARTLATLGALLLILAALLRLLSVYVLVSDPRLQKGYLDRAGPDPAIGLYSFSNDGRQVRFERGIFDEEGVWQGGVYTLNLDDGTIKSGDLEPQPSLYVVDNGQVLLKDNSPGSPRLSLSPTSGQVIHPVVSADGQAMAYIDQPTASVRRLYAIRGITPAELIAEERGIREITWAPGNDRLAYVASYEGGEELFLYNFSDRTHSRLTDDGNVKSSPRFSRDGLLVAFLAAPISATAPSQVPAAQFQPQNPAPASGIDIYIIGADGQNQRRLTETVQDETSLAWTAGNEIAFSAWQPEWPAVAYLFALAPAGGEARRIYPPVAIEGFTCRPALPGGSQVHVQVEVSNDSVQAVNVPLEVSAGHQPLDLITNRSQFRVQREDLSLQAGETRSIEWTVDAPEDIIVYLAASIESGVDFPISARFCQVTPRRLFLPRLPLLQTTLLLGLLGSVLCLPWLRHLRRKWLWLIWGAYGVLLVGLIAIESVLLLNR